MTRRCTTHHMCDCTAEKMREMEHTFDLRWKADMRAIERWRAERPKERELRQPDHADLCVWLLEQLAERDSRLERSRRQAFLDGTLAARWIKSPEPPKTYHDCCVELADKYAAQEPVAEIRNGEIVNPPILAEGNPVQSEDPIKAAFVEKLTP